MGSFPARLDQPPPQPPEVSGQQGALGGISSMLQEKFGQRPPGEAAPPSEVHPQGAMLAQFEAVKKVLTQMARMNEGYMPFVNRAIAILQAGLGEVISKGRAGPGVGEPPPEAGAMSAPPSARAPEGESSRSFPG